MYIYEKEDDKVKVFDLALDKKRISAYKKKNEENCRVIFARTNDKNVLEEKFNYSLVNKYELNYQNINRTLEGYEELYHCLFALNNKMSTQYVLDNYINGQYCDKKMLKVEDGQEEEYSLLLTQDKYDVCNNDVRLMRDILLLPKSLYLLHLLENGRFDLLSDEDVSKLLKLCILSIYPVDEFNMSYLSRLVTTGLMPVFTYENIYKNVDDTTKILKKIRS